MKSQFQAAADSETAHAAPMSSTSASLPPLLAGARARGMADAFELLGVAAAFIDEAGFALHINDRARRLLGPQLWVDDGRLRAADRDLDEALSAAIESALINGAPARAATDISFASELRGAVAVKVLPVAAEAHDPFQLLRAVVIIEEQGYAAPWRDKGRLAGLN
ncbi:hypothetical protein [Methylocapsa sp. S129]|uniref:hypothetical protein n=1 Tax=Methylocapsa sp. S129 TaxID=1641869 RepID=UPI00131E7311|nr:hypothetical protein [Methylocapsa sp. S129]